MNEHGKVKSLGAQNLSCQLARHSIKAMLAVMGFAVLMGGPVYAADPVSKKTAAKERIVPVSTEIAPRMEFSPGQSHLIKMPTGVSLAKVKVEDDKVVQVEVTSPKEIVLHAKAVGNTSLMIWDKSGRVTVMDVAVLGAASGMGAAALQGKLNQLLPTEKGIVVTTAGTSLVLSGTVEDAVKVDKAIAIAEAYAGKDKVINMLHVGAPQQVMLEVKMAEISKNLLDQLGVAFNFSRANGGVAYSLLNGFRLPQEVGGKLVFTNGDTSVTIDAEKKDTLIKVLAEPNIIAISGQEGSFLAGGKFYIPVPQGGTNNAITLEEKDFGVGLRFTPTVLESGIINLRVAPEVTELLTATLNLGSLGTSPTLSTRRVATTVQLRDGQSFAIAGLIKSNIVEDVKRFPILGELPIIGALFRSSAFKDEKTELLFVVTPRLVKPLPPDYALPTDSFNPPSRTEFFIEGKLEGKPSDAPVVPKATTTDAVAPKPVEQNPNDGFEMK